MFETHVTSYTPLTAKNFPTRTKIHGLLKFFVKDLFNCHFWYPTSALVPKRWTEFG